MSDPTSPQASTTGTRNGKPRKARLLVFALLCALAGAGYTLHWLLVARHLVSTDNAYVQGHVVQVTPLAAGTVIAVDAEDTDTVQAGQTLVRLDPVDSQLALDEAEAQLAQTVREVRTLYAENQALGALVKAREADLKRSETERARLQADLARRKNLVEGGAISVEDLQHRRSAVATAESAHAAALAALSEARGQLLKNTTQTDGTTVETHPRVLAAAARYREAWLAHQRREIVAPLGGTVARRSVQLGQRVNVGVPIMAIVSLEQLWVDANFKESQLQSLRIGQRVTLTADVYGRGTEFHGHIAGLGAGTGAAFSLLPAQNATGNWIKIVQRVPVRVALDAGELAEHPLRVGLSMTATVDVRDRSGPAVAGSPQGSQPASVTTVYDALDTAADERVDAIVSRNLGRSVHLRRAR